MNKKIKNLLLLVVGIAVLIFGLSRLHIQSVSEFQKESEELSEQLQMEKSTGVELNKQAVSGTAAGPSEQPGENPVGKGIESAGNDSSGNASGQKDDAKTDSEKNAAKKQKSAPEVSAKDKKGTKKKNIQKRSKADSDADKKPSATPSGQKKDTITCTIQIRCDSLNENRDELSEQLLPYVPENGILLAKTKVTAAKGSSVYDILSKVCRAEGIAVDAEYTPMYGSYYVRGIGHLYEMDAGDMSGWLYTVNGKKPDIGASGFVLSDGDDIVWGYSCDGWTYD